jgi:hypothetical protein
MGAVCVVDLPPHLAVDWLEQPVVVLDVVLQHADSGLLQQKAATHTSGRVKGWGLAVGLGDRV